MTQKINILKIPALYIIWCLYKGNKMEACSRNLRRRHCHKGMAAWRLPRQQLFLLIFWIFKGFISCAEVHIVNTISMFINTLLVWFASKVKWKIKVGLHVHMALFCTFIFAFTM